MKAEVSREDNKVELSLDFLPLMKYIEVWE